MQSLSNNTEGDKDGEAKAPEREYYQKEYKWIVKHATCFSLQHFQKRSTEGHAQWQKASTTINYDPGETPE